MSENPKNKGGRPKVHTEKFIEEHAQALIDFMNTPVLDAIGKPVFPFWLKDYAIHNRFPSENLSRWAATNEKFAQALKIAKDIQERRLISVGLSGVPGAATMAIFALKNVAGWRNELPEDDGKGKKVYTLTITDAD